MTGPQLFISYSRVNTDFAHELSTRLITLGFSLWRDRSQMDAGEDWWRQIQEAIREVETMVLLLSPQALASPVVAREWRYARQMGTRVISIIAEKVDFGQVPRWMGKLDWLASRQSAPISSSPIARLASSSFSLSHFILPARILSAKL